MDHPDRTDIEASLRGDGAAFSRLIRRHQDAVAKRMRRFARDSQTVEELVHDVFVEAYLSLRTFRREAPFERWLAVIATRVGYRYWQQRDRARRIAQFDDGVAAPADSDVRRQDAAESLEGVLAQLSVRDRLVVTLLYLEERSVAEAAEHTGWSESMVKVQAFRARRKLRRIMAARGIEHE